MRDGLQLAVRVGNHDSRHQCVSRVQHADVVALVPVVVYHRLGHHGTTGGVRVRWERHRAPKLTTQSPAMFNQFCQSSIEMGPIWGQRVEHTTVSFTAMVLYFLLYLCDPLKPYL